jgi:HSP20 family protein
MFSTFPRLNDPWTMMDSLERQMERAFSRRQAPAFEARDLVLRDHGDTLEVLAEVPGASEADVDLVLHQGVLELKVERSWKAPEGYTLTRSERRDVRFHHRIELPYAVQADFVTAKLEDGVLTITLPKVLEAAPRKIPIGRAAVAPSTASPALA